MNSLIAFLWLWICRRHNYNNETYAMSCFMFPKVSKRWGVKNCFVQVVVTVWINCDWRLAKFVILWYLSIGFCLAPSASLCLSACSPRT